MATVIGMGHRAHYVIVQDGSWDLYFSQWGASDLDLDLLPGPDFALRFIDCSFAGDSGLQSWGGKRTCRVAAHGRQPR
jgi:hypothetical protein